MIHVDVVLMLSQKRHGLRHNLLHGLRGIGFRHIEQDSGHLVKQFPGLLECGYRIPECRLVILGNYGVNFSLLTVNTYLYGRYIVLFLYFLERRQPIRGIPVRKKRICPSARSHSHNHKCSHQ